MEKTRGVVLAPQASRSAQAKATVLTPLPEFDDGARPQSRDNAHKLIDRRGAERPRSELDPVEQSRQFVGRWTAHVVADD